MEAVECVPISTSGALPTTNRYAQLRPEGHCRVEVQPLFGDCGAMNGIRIWVVIVVAALCAGCNGCNKPAAPAAAPPRGTPTTPFMPTQAQPKLRTITL